MPPKQAPNSARGARRVSSWTRVSSPVPVDVELGGVGARASARPLARGGGDVANGGAGSGGTPDLYSSAAGMLAVPVPKPPEARKKGVSTKRKVLKFDEEGRVSMVDTSKVAITHQLGVNSRDLRLLDPKLATSYPSAILCRDQALVVNMEQVKCVITRHYLLLLNPEDEAVLPFVQELQKKLGPAGRPEPPPPSEVGSEAVAGSEFHSSAAGDMPFELRALEVVLDTVSAQMERLASDLEAAAHPALDALTAKVTTHNLERVRRIKNRLVRLTTRVETLREVLEKFLDDDNDMKDMNLSAKYEAHLATLQRRSLEHAAHSAELQMPTPLSVGGTPAPFTAWEDQDSDSDSDVDEVEYMLETYFMQLDNTHNKLQTLMEYIDDTEDYINIELDSHRNHIIQLDLVLSTGTAAAGFVAAIGSIYGMNLANNPEGVEDDTYGRFLGVSIGTCAAAVAFFLLVIGFLYRKRLIGF